MLSILCAQIYRSKTLYEAAVSGYWFGVGFFLTALYWISFGVTVYIDEFLWAVPFALFGLPAFLAIFTAIISVIAYRFKLSIYYHFLFCVTWIFIEWVMSWIFTGLPWALIGYAFNVSEILIQPASLFGILGLSFSGIFIGSIFYGKEFLSLRIFIASIIIISTVLYGVIRLANNPTEYSKVKIRIVQPSIKQVAKWDPEIFWENIYKHISLSMRKGEPDIIIWSEAALTAPYYYEEIYENLMTLFSKKNQFLLTGSVSDNGREGELLELYSSFIALSDTGELIFDYRKSHLVPFGEYMPLGEYIPLKKITPGIIDYTPGKREIKYLPQLNLSILPLVCYESIFYNESRVSNIDVDLIINITNDAWYGNSSGPYQHFEISRIRAVENALPMIRSGNNGISAVIDPAGRVIAKLALNEVDILDSYLPIKLGKPTLFSKLGNISVVVFILLVLIIQKICFIFRGKITERKFFS